MYEEQRDRLLKTFLIQLNVLQVGVFNVKRHPTRPSSM